MPENPSDQAKTAPAVLGQHTPPRSAAPDEQSFPVVAIGASAGGLDACKKFLAAVPPDPGMAFILVQHLDPNHDSMLVELLTSHTSMTVLQATDGMPIQRDHLYIIPPATYLSVADGTLRLSDPIARHGARLPFDFLLNALAASYGALSMCVILSGTGSDGSIGLKAIKANHGFVVAQDPEEAPYNGMPRSAIMTGGVDRVLPVSSIPQALLDHDSRIPLTDRQSGLHPDVAIQNWLPDMIDLLRSRTGHDFSLYKPGTLLRRIERRMGMAAVEPGNIERYREILLNDPNELELLAKDLLINVTSFFRDPAVFDMLARQTVPDMVRAQRPDAPLRIWIVGCSTGEETYSLAMLFREAMADAQRDIKVQMFATDVDADAIAIARDGLYSDAIEADVSADRLARFFSREGQFYRVLPELRAMLVFTVQDVLADPPFSRLDMVSCRNLLIYLRPEAQTKVIALFHFALRENGTLLLGGSETAGNIEGRFEVISKQERIFRKIGRGRPGEFAMMRGMLDGGRAPQQPVREPSHTRRVALEQLCQRLVLETYSPAAVLINRRSECLYSLGPTDRYLRVPPGPPTFDLLAMARQGMRTKLRSAIQRAMNDNAPIVVPGGRTTDGTTPVQFSIAVHPVRHDGEDLLLVCFVNDQKAEPRREGVIRTSDAPRVAELEQELDATRAELQGAIHNLEMSSEEQKTINEEALSVQEEFQSTNEELLTSKEELQSLNEELTALNGQLQETLERQRTSANDLQNVLYSTDVATLFLDTSLRIRFFTPATRAVFSIIPSDIGRPLADLTSLATDATLLTDAETVLHTRTAMERQIETRNNTWFTRRILPYRTQDHGVEGVVITFTDITEQRRSAVALEAAKRQAETANLAKSRFLAAASHDLRQPLQTLSLIQGLLAKIVEGERPKKLLSRLEETLDAMSGMLNTLLDINQIDAGTIRVEMQAVPINALFEKLRGEFSYHAQAKGLTLRVVPCSLSVHSDPRLLEQMLRNLISNALKYTQRGKVLLGCRRQGGIVSVQVLDTGIGIPDKDLQLIFEEYQQLGNPSRERGRGLGLGLSIAQSLAQLLGHKVKVRSRPSRGSCFAIELPRHDGDDSAPPGDDLPPDSETPPEPANRSGTIMVIEDDPDVSDLLGTALKSDGHRGIAVTDGVAALELIAKGMVRPDLILVDYNLPNGMDGVEVTRNLRAVLGRDVPVIILTGDISTQTLRAISLEGLVPLNKPVKLADLSAAVLRALPEGTVMDQTCLPQPGPARHPVIFVVDDDRNVRDSIRGVMQDVGHVVEDFESAEAFLAAYQTGREGCLLVDAYLPGMSGLALLRRLRDAGQRLPSIMITGNSDVSIAVRAMKAGALDFIEKPIGRTALLAAVERALELSHDSTQEQNWQDSAARHMASLSQRQRQIMEMVLAGYPSKNIAADLGISQRTVENHRASIMKKTGTKSLPELARLALAAGWRDEDEAAAQAEETRSAAG